MSHRPNTFDESFVAFHTRQPKGAGHMSIVLNRSSRCQFFSRSPRTNMVSSCKRTGRGGGGREASIWKIVRSPGRACLFANVPRPWSAGSKDLRQFAAGVELHAQVPAEDPPGEAAGLRHGETDRGPREGAAQDLHIPGGHIHRCHRLSESARKFHFVSRYRYTRTFPFARSLSSFFFFFSPSRTR